ncbi:ATP-dependent DNA helicase PIF1 [Brachionus plicatilis]|uniref:ATP-dependent DNA helicase PIF1 n=1 Tax=Brachionus plicatilis TaxID=10195 RepID=A0A3M7Q7A4_BRAPC|nr:ATP-dependent DNA helicase PIF1 [Brachionus plicatilis]
MTPQSNSIFKDPTLSIPKCKCGAADHRSIRNLKCKYTTKNRNSALNPPITNIAPKDSSSITKETYLKEFNSLKYGPLHKQPWVLYEIQKFHTSVREYETFYCTNCSELWPTKLAKCETCHSYKNKFTSHNDMNPNHHLLIDEVKKCLYNLTMIEEMLISPILPVMSVYRLTGGQLVTKGYVINFKQYISKVVTALPRLINELPILVIKKQEKLNLLPNDQIPNYFNEITYEQLNIHEKEILNQDLGPKIVQNHFEDDTDSHFFIQPEEEKVLQFDKIKQKLNWPTISTAPINEFEFDGLCSLVFPKLFSFGSGDQTKKSHKEMVSESLAVQHLLKYATVNSKTKFNYYPFAEHPRFKFWMYDRISRHRTLDQIKVYLKQNPGDANMTINELKKMLNDGSAEQLLRKMTPYSANITGSNAYWYQRRIELESTFEQKKPATVFFTFSYADNHWEDLHRLLPGEGKASETKVITYAETLLSAMNSRSTLIYDGQSEIHSNYENLANFVQRHVCRPDGYCKSKKGKECRFEFPIQLQDKTEIVFKEIENTIIAEIKLKRNDSNMNVHNILCCHHWRGNTDMQIIIDKNAAIRYMVKYAAKPEKSSQTYMDTLRTIYGQSNEEDDPRTKLRSLMLKTSCSQRDIGQCEVCRLLMSGPLCQSSFKYVTQILDINSRQIQLVKKNN